MNHPASIRCHTLVRTLTSIVAVLTLTNAFPVLALNQAASDLQSSDVSLREPKMLAAGEDSSAVGRRPSEAGAFGSGSRTESHTAPVSYHTTDGPVRLTVTADRTAALVADPIAFTVHVTAENGVSVTFPQAGESVGEFHVTAVDDTFDIPSGDGRTWTRRFRLEALKSGSFAIPAMTVNYSDARTVPAVTGSVASRPVTVEIGSLLETTDDPLRFRDIKGVVELIEEPEPSYRWVLWLLAAGAGTALTASVLLCLRKRTLTAEQWALQQLDRLERDGLAGSGDMDTFYCRVTDVVREYIERAHGVHAPKQTTAEFLSQVESENRFGDSQRSLLRALLLIADRVKFARFHLSEGDTSDAIGKARKFVSESQATSRGLADQRPRSPRTSPVVRSDMLSGGNRS